MDNLEIGKALYLSPHTARTYVSRLLTKLDAHERAHWCSWPTVRDLSSKDGE